MNGFCKRQVIHLNLQLYFTKADDCIVDSFSEQSDQSSIDISAARAQIVQFKRFDNRKTTQAEVKQPSLRLESLSSTSHVTKRVVFDVGPTARCYRTTLSAAELSSIDRIGFRDDLASFLAIVSFCGTVES